jgi:hypothetical protein
MGRIHHEEPHEALVGIFPVGAPDGGDQPDIRVAADDRRLGGREQGVGQLVLARRVGERSPAERGQGPEMGAIQRGEVGNAGIMLDGLAGSLR